MQKKKTIIMSFLFLCVAGFAAPGELVAGEDYVPGQVILKFRATVTDMLTGSSFAAGAEAAGELKQWLAPYGLKFHADDAIRPLVSGAGKSLAEKNRLQARSKAGEKLSEKEQRLLDRYNRVPEGVEVPAIDGIYLLSLGSGETVAEAVARLAKNPAVEYAEPNYIAQMDLEPDDPYYGDPDNDFQWYLNNTGHDYPDSGRFVSPPGTADKDIDAPEAWDILRDTPYIIVGVVDSGTDYNHRDLAGNLWTNSVEQNGTAGVDDDGNGYVDDIYGYDFHYHTSDPIDYFGHGTHCAGIIAAKGDNDTDVAGVCWNARVMTLKCMDDAGYLFVSNVIEAFLYAIDMGADILSNSWSGPNPSQALQDIINYARSRGVLVVAACGNNGNSTEVYPGAYDNVLSVAATDSNDDKASFSNYGSWVDVAAPGVDILNLRAGGIDFGTVYNDYLTISSGTSMACPVVVGVAALVMQNNMLLKIDEVIDIVTNSGDPITPGICASDTRVNAYAALQATITETGRVKFQRDTYSDALNVTFLITDAGLTAPSYSGIRIMNLSTLDTEELTVNKVVSSVYYGTISTASGAANLYDGILQVGDGNRLIVYYSDADDGSGNPAVVSDTADVDCSPPVISAVSFAASPLGPRPEVTVTTNEYAEVKIRYNTSPSTPFPCESTGYGTSSVIPLIQVEPSTTYYFEVVATDDAANTTVDNNSGSYYQFTSSASAATVYVPAGFSTVQDAIDAAWDNTTIVVSPGTYGPIKLNGKKIVVTGTNPDNWGVVESTIITNSGTGEYFCAEMAKGETRDTVLRGITLYAPFSDGGGLRTICSNPVIDRCKITAGTAGYGCYLIGGRPLIKDCVINNFSWGIYAINGVKADITGCEIIDGANGIEITTTTIHGRIDSNRIHGCAVRGISIRGQKNPPVLNNFIYDTAKGLDVGEHCIVSISGNTIVDCSTAGIFVKEDTTVSALAPSISNTILWSNTNDFVLDGTASLPSVRYCCIEDSGINGTGVIHPGAGPLFVNPAADDFHIQSTSSCKDAGDPAYAPIAGETDIDGDSRVINGTIDIGADEL